MGTIILTSQGFYNSQTIKEIENNLLRDKTKSRVAIITTAADEKEANKYNQLAKKLFLKNGFQEVDFIDLEFEKLFDPSLFDVIYVCGGNTFRLLKFALKTNFKSAIRKFLDKGGVYLGVSAGSMILCPSIRFASEFSRENDNIGLDDFSGLNLIPIIIFPHYNQSIESKLHNYEKRTGEKLVRLTDNQFIVIKNGDNIGIID